MVSSRLLALCLLSLLSCRVQAQLSTTGFYVRTCPKLQTIVSSVMAKAVANKLAWVLPFFDFSFKTSNFPSPDSSLSTLISAFVAKNMSPHDMTALSGAHTIGQARCTTFRSQIYNDSNINPNFATLRKQSCPSSGGDNKLAPLDLHSPNRFGIDYYQNLVGRTGVLHSDQELFNNGIQDSLVRQYSSNTQLFFSDFAAAMVKMGSWEPLVCLWAPTVRFV